MKALVKKSPTPGADLVDLETPTPKDGEILIEVKAAAICGTDLHFYRWDSAASNFTVNFPLILGHEYAGNVVKLGKGVKRISIGDQVSVETHIPCDQCYQCHLGQAHNCQNLDLVGITYPGAFAEYAVVPEKVAFRLPQGLSCEEGSLFEPAGVAMRGIDEAEIKPGDVVAVIGCGPIGLVAVRIAQLCGASAVIAIDIDDFRLDMARQFGAVTLNPKTDDIAEQVRKTTGRRGGADVVLEISGASAAYEFVFEILRPEGRVVSVGHVAEPVPIHIAKQINIKGVSLKGVFGRRIWDTWEHLFSFVEAGKLDLSEFITHRFPLDAYKEAFQQAQGNAAKIILSP